MWYAFLAACALTFIVRGTTYITAWLKPAHTLFDFMSSVGACVIWVILVISPIAYFKTLKDYYGKFFGTMLRRFKLARALKRHKNVVDNDNLLDFKDSDDFINFLVFDKDGNFLNNEMFLVHKNDHYLTHLDREWSFLIVDFNMLRHNMRGMHRVYRYDWGKFLVYLKKFHPNIKMVRPVTT